jgi:glyoxylase I family protein
MLFTGFEHTALASPEPEKLAQWYVDTLGFRINYEYDGNYFVRASDGTMLEIIPSQGDAVATSMRTPGIRHLAVAVTDFDAGHEALKTKGVTFLTDVLDVKGNRLVFFADRDGNILHLIARPQPLP